MGLFKSNDRTGGRVHGKKERFRVHSATGKGEKGNSASASNHHVCSEENGGLKGRVLASSAGTESAAAENLAPRKDGAARH